jgi:serine/threonine protein kinase
LFASSGYPSSPTPSPAPTYGNDASSDAAHLPIQFITPELIQLRLRLVSALVPRQGWKSASIVYQWAIKHPKTALLLWMAGDLAAWPKANLWGLEDAKLPYVEDDLVGVAAEPALVVELQWRVAIKQLPRDGRHTEFQTQETVPLREVRAQLAATQGAMSKRLDCVVYYDSISSVGSGGGGVETGGGKRGRIHVRKRLDITNKPDKESLLAQLRAYHSIISESDGRSLHPNLSPIISSYARGQTVAFLTPHMPSNLNEFLDVFAGLSIAEQLLRWIKDLASVMSFLHDKGIFHGAVRPQKILVDDEEEEGGKGRVQLAVFGVRQPARAGGALFAPYSTDPAYIYAAPESLSRSTSDKGSKRETGGAAADVFALGCVFLEMVTAARGLPVSKLAEYRAAQSHDASYHANLERLAGWIDILKKEKAGGGTARKERVNAGILRVLNAVRGMVAPDPADRPVMKRVLAYLDQGESGRKPKMQPNSSPPRAREKNGGSSSPREQSGAKPSPPKEQSARTAQNGRSKAPRRRSVDIAMELTRPEMVVRPELTRLELRPGLTMRRAALIPVPGVWGDLESLNGYYREKE